jgi:hypothetical protein
LKFLKKTRKSEKFGQKPILLKKNPAENACAFGETGVYVLLWKFIEIIDFFVFFQACFSGTARSFLFPLEPHVSKS